MPPDHIIRERAGCLLLLLACELFALPSTSRGDATDSARLPIVHCTVTCGEHFVANDPTVWVVYSNASTSVSVGVTVPSSDVERRLWGPGIGFDGGDADYADQGFIERYGDHLPTRTVALSAGDTCRVEYRVRDRYRVPSCWTNLEVRPGHSRQYTASADRKSVV